MAQSKTVVVCPPLPANDPTAVDLPQTSPEHQQLETTTLFSGAALHDDPIGVDITPTNAP